MAARERFRAKVQAMKDEENRVANEQGTWQNWVWTHVPQPIDFVGIHGTPYNLGSAARRWDGKPQLGYDVGLFMYEPGGNNLPIEHGAPLPMLDNTQRLPAITDVEDAYGVIDG